MFFWKNTHRERERERERRDRETGFCESKPSPPRRCYATTGGARRRWRCACCRRRSSSRSGSSSSRGPRETARSLSRCICIRMFNSCIMSVHYMAEVEANGHRQVPCTRWWRGSSFDSSTSLHLEVWQ